MEFFSRTFALSRVLLIALPLLLVAMIGAYSYGRSDGKMAIELENANARHIALKQSYDAGERAAEARLADQRRQLEAENKYEHAIADAPGGRNSPAASALACERLRRAGFGDAELPAECRPSGGH